jgi:hypothetical protein
MIKAALVACALACSISPAGAYAYDCPTIKYYVRLYGKLAVIRWAQQNGFDLADIHRAQRACYSR